MTKKARVERAPRELTRKQATRLERERRAQRALTISVVAVAVIVVGLLATGLIIENVVKARVAVAVVNGEPIHAVDFQAYVRFMRMQLNQQLSQLRSQRQSIDTSEEGADYLLEYFDGQITQLEGQLSATNVQAIGDQALDQLILYELVGQECDRRGIAVSDDEVQEDLELGFGYDRTAATIPLTQTEVVSPSAEITPEATPMTEERFQELYDQVVSELLKPNKISEKQYRAWVRGDLLAEKLRSAMADDLPAQEEQVQLRILSVQDAEAAQVLVNRLDAGETMDTFSEEFEAAEEAPGYVTELDWFPRSMLEDGLGAELTELAFSLPVGGHSQAVLGPDGASYYIIEVLGREVRDLEDSVREELAGRAFEEWFRLQKDTGVEYRETNTLVPSEP